jgi:Restriction endonuclease
MSETSRLDQVFRGFVVALFSAEKYSVDQIQGGGRDRRIDLMVSTPEGQKAVVEIKLFRTRIVSRANIINAVAQVDMARRVTGADRGILIISSSLAIPIIDIGDNEIWDMKRLGEKVARHSVLVPLFESLLRELSSSLPISDLDIYAYTVFGDAITGEPQAPITEPAQEGAKLEKALRAVAPGKKGARSPARCPHCVLEQQNSGDRGG